MYRAILGSLLAVVGIFIFGALRQLSTDNLIWGVIGFAAVIVVAYWVLMLFLEGIEDGVDTGYRTHSGDDRP
ncbi:hypothetical protein E6P09_09805 [Haloferax mediterranei ATCC 33500]|uniref:Uncharacterized protein n=1 Tax=Haloferax mediterranei (strain ATCC 33500 / DSM 1411 / JCM 8866 / NBRC 14739 / NCIMB 2177 / R-4) TaxID=523841 RepID=I3R4A7_HALMT|nr:hypothetical protein HFX_1356 [Haloferax mediterranei ATCC 33500]EMA04036.1 hypothetical protein C439_03723 [Haloferax mediterranei ATCC 33500]QCQ76643.1 hypothetical protein E6P09_09805 [Haloferax mediterranei ATCC 33500]